MFKKLKRFKLLTAAALLVLTAVSAYAVELYLNDNGDLVTGNDQYVAKTTTPKAGTLVIPNGTVQTFPSSTASIARTDAAQTFLGNQTITGNLTVAGTFNNGIGGGNLALSGVTGTTTTLYSFDSIGSGLTLTFTATSGVVQATPTIVGAGTGYKVGDLLSIAQNGSQTNAVVHVLTLSGSTVASIELLSGGTGYVTTAVAQATQAAPAPLGILTITGTMTASSTFILPYNIPAEWNVVNNTTGAYTLTFKIGTVAGVSTGTGVVVAQGSSNSLSMYVYTDGVTDVWVAGDSYTSLYATTFAATGSVTGKNFTGTGTGVSTLAGGLVTTGTSLNIGNSVYQGGLSVTTGTLATVGILNTGTLLSTGLGTFGAGMVNTGTFTSDQIIVTGGMNVTGTMTSTGNTINSTITITCPQILTTDTTVLRGACWVADNAYTVKRITGVCNNCGTNTNYQVSVEKATGTTAAGSGNNLMTGVFPMNTTSGTNYGVMTGTLTGTTTLAAGDRLNLVIPTAMTSSTGVSVSITVTHTAP